jgi:hypothetical protein
MTPVSNVNSTALLILQQAKPAQAAGQPKADLAATANGVSSKTAQTTQDDSMLEVTRLKVDLFERTGQALGVNMKDYASLDKYAAALRQAISQIKALNPERWPEIKAGIEHELGLDKLGVSLDTVVDSIGNTDGESNKALTKALEKQIAKGGGGFDNAKAPYSAVQINEIGLYSPAKV